MIKPDFKLKAYTDARKSVLRDLIKTGDFLVVSCGEWKLAKMIQKNTGFKEHHVGVFIWIWDVLYVFEFEGGGGTFTPWDSEKYNMGRPKDRSFVITRANFDIPEKEAAHIIMANANKKYDFVGLGAQWVNLKLKLKAWFGITGKEATTSFYCSEFAAFLANHFNPKIFKEWWSASPGQFMHQHPYQFKIVMKWDKSW